MGDGNYISRSIYHNNLPNGGLFVKRIAGTNKRILREVGYNKYNVLDVEYQQKGFKPAHPLQSSGSLHLKCLMETEVEEPIRFSEKYFIPTKQRRVLRKLGITSVEENNNPDADAISDQPMLNSTIMRFSADLISRKIITISDKQWITMYKEDGKDKLLKIIEKLINFHPDLAENMSIIKRLMVPKGANNSRLITLIVQFYHQLVLLEAHRNQTCALTQDDIRELLNDNEDDQIKKVTQFLQIPLTVSAAFILSLIAPTAKNSNKLAEHAKNQASKLQTNEITPNVEVAKLDELISTLERENLDELKLDENETTKVLDTADSSYITKFINLFRKAASYGMEWLLNFLLDKLLRLWNVDNTITETEYNKLHQDLRDGVFTKIEDYVADPIANLVNPVENDGSNDTKSKYIIDNYV